MHLKNYITQDLKTPNQTRQEKGKLDENKIANTRELNLINQIAINKIKISSFHITPILCQSLLHH